MQESPDTEVTTKKHWKKTAENEELDLNSDLYQLGLHLHFDHGFTEPEAFDQHIKFGILEIVNPVDINKKEYKWMHNINSFQPNGINVKMSIRDIETDVMSVELIDVKKIYNFSLLFNGFIYLIGKNKVGWNWQKNSNLQFFCEWPTFLPTRI